MTPTRTQEESQASIHTFVRRHADMTSTCIPTCRQHHVISQTRQENEAVRDSPRHDLKQKSRIYPRFDTTVSVKSNLASKQILTTYPTRSQWQFRRLGNDSKKNGDHSNAFGLCCNPVRRDPAKVMIMTVPNSLPSLPRGSPARCSNHVEYIASQVPARAHAHRPHSRVWLELANQLIRDLDCRQR